MLRSLVETPSVPAPVEPLTRKRPNFQVEIVTVQKDKVVPVNLLPPKVETTATNENAGNSSQTKQTAYEVSQQMLDRCIIRVIGDSVFYFDGNFYRALSMNNLHRLIVDNCRDAVRAVGRPHFVTDVGRHICQEPRIFEAEVLPDQNLIFFENGVLDLRNGNLISPSPQFNAFYKVKSIYAENHHPRFDEFLQSVTHGDALLAQRIYEVIGYCIAPDVSKKFFFLLQGTADFGKSILANFIRGCFNHEATVSLDFDDLTSHFAPANLVGKQLCLSMDLPAAPIRAKAASLFKNVTGGDYLSADVKFSSYVTFLNHAKFLFGSNHPLLTQDYDPAFFKRAVTIPFLYSVAPNAQDPGLLEKLNGERNAIVFDALQAYFALRARGYHFSGDFPVNGGFVSNLAGGKTCVSDLERAASFLKEYCVPSDDGRVFVETLFIAFCARFPEAEVDLERFSTLVLRGCSLLSWHNVHRGKKERMEKGKNPQATLLGITFKEVEEIDSVQ